MAVRSSAGRAQKSVTVILSNAEIKALPGTPIVVVSAPRAGFMIVPTFALLIAKFAGGLYEDVAETGDVAGSLVLTTDPTQTEASFNLLDSVTNAGFLDINSGGTDDVWISLIAKARTPFGDGGWTLDDYAGKSLSLAMLDRDGNTDPLVGGHANNTLTVVVWYDIVRP